MHSATFTQTYSQMSGNTNVFLYRLDPIPAAFKTALRTNNVLLIPPNRKVTFQNLALIPILFRHSEVPILELMLVSQDQDKQLGH